jgi:hypothetical protein
VRRPTHTPWPAGERGVVSLARLLRNKRMAFMGDSVSVQACSAVSRVPR